MTPTLFDTGPSRQKGPALGTVPGARCRRCNGETFGKPVRFSNLPAYKRAIFHAECFGSGSSKSEAPGSEAPAATPPPEFDFEGGKGELEGDGQPTTASEWVACGDRSELPRYEESEPLPGNPAGRAVAALAAALEASGLIAPAAPGLDEATVRQLVEGIIAERHTTRIEVTSDTRPQVVIEGAHSMMPVLVAHMAARQHCHVWGPPGSGKSTAVKTAAHALGLPYFYRSLGPQEFPSALAGFISPVDGTYHGTAFRKAVEHGGVFCLEEVDNASSTVLVTLNNLTENGYASFPDQTVAVHPDFLLVIVSNTRGRGGDDLFPERRAIDGAFLDRFPPIKWEYDVRHEQAIALGYCPQAGPWVEWVQAVRAWLTSRGKKAIIISPRASYGGAKAIKQGALSLAQIAESFVLGRMDADTRRECLAAHPLGSGV